ncbi:toxic anion resistance protein [Agrobacterium rubi]|nr:toxic anion resistance protein [Agrobacterium rubi]NTF25169.1 toxic anion resistance protein [Agrobacterium rubi]
MTITKDYVHDLDALVAGKCETETTSSLVTTPSTIRNELDLRNPNSILMFGASAQEKSVRLSEDLLAGVLNKDVGPVRDSLNDIVLKIRGLDVEQLNGKAPGFVGRIMGKVAPIVRFTQQYETVSSQIDTIAAGLQKHVRTLMTDIEGLEQRYALARHELKHLEAYIETGQVILTDIRVRLIPAAQMKADQSGDLLHAQEYRELVGRADEFERRIHDLILSRQLVIQELVELRAIQDVDTSLVAKIRSVSTTTLGLWKKQIHRAVAATRTIEAAEAVSGVGKLTNELIVSTSEQVRHASSEARRQIEAGLTDVETITKANENLLAMIDDSIRIAEQGRETRRAAEAQILVLEERTKDRLKSLSSAPQGEQA